MEYTWIPNFIVLIVSLLVLASKIPIYIAVFWYFDKKIVWFSFLGSLISIIYGILTIVFMWIDPRVAIFFAFVIVFTIICVLGIILKCLLTVNIFILKTFLIFDVSIPSDFGYLKYQEKIGGFTNGLSLV